MEGTNGRSQDQFLELRALVGSAQSVTELNALLARVWRAYYAGTLRVAATDGAIMRCDREQRYLLVSGEQRAS